jgi:hypothetical protein
MIPFYPMGDNKMNGNGLPMAYCLAHRGLMQAHDPVFSEEVKAGKKFIFFQLTVRLPISLFFFSVMEMAWSTVAGLLSPY